jgi:mono/diheme cytochrome c family protein
MFASIKMRLGLVGVLLLAGAVLAGCNFTLAADITPPPDYVPPTPMPTLGPLYPASAPNLQDGAAIFADKCVPCHGSKGLGDGPQSMQLPVAVPAIGLPETARPATPADWFKTVTQGNIDRFMPPFAGSLTEQQRWDVVAYALSLHTKSDEISRGKALVESDCPDCAAAVADQEKMAALSENDLVSMIRNGSDQIPAFGKGYSDQQAYGAAEYLRSLTFAGEAQLAVAPATPVEATAQPGTPEAAASSAPSAAGTAAPEVGQVTGSVELPVGGAATGLTVTLHGYDHAADGTSGPQEVLTLSGPVNEDGSYAFDDVGLPLNRIFIAEVKYAGVSYRSGFQAATAGSTSINMPALKLYDASMDMSKLTIEQVHIYADFSTKGTVQVLEIYAFNNSSDTSVIISTDGSSIPFIQLPKGATNAGYEAGQDSASFVSADQGLAVVPSDKPYSIVAFFNLPYDQQLEITQPVAIDTPSLILLVPEGIAVKGTQLQSQGVQAIQNNNYEEFAAADLKEGQTLSFTLSGQPGSSPAAVIDAHQGLVIGGAFLGALLIGAGLFLYARERRRLVPVVTEAEFETQDEVLDAILALDDLHRAGKIADAAYNLRRDELKEQLRELS